MKFLCICQWGHSRSVALCRVLHGLGHGAVAIGECSNGGAIHPLSEWADKILVLQPMFADAVPQQHRVKIIDFDVGPDRWSNPYNQELLEILRQMVTLNLPDLKQGDSL